MKERKIQYNAYSPYIITSIIIIITVCITLYIKGVWPFGNKAILRGDFLAQTVPFAMELKRKILSGESILYSWNGGLGMNFLSVITYCLANPFVLILLLAPEAYAVKMGSVVILMLTLTLNSSMLYYITHRPVRALSFHNPIAMVLSLSYSMSAYMVSFMDIWYYLVCACFFPIILLGLEYYVYEGKWKLYFIALVGSFFSNYYLAGLFCLFIIVYYLTLEFGDIRNFWKKSVWIVLISISAIGIDSVFLIPTVQQLVQTPTMVTEYSGRTWFLSFWDEIQYFFVFQKATFIGSTTSSYGENHVYYGILPLMLTGLYFTVKEISIKERVKKFVGVVLYLVAFDMNILNYIMHLGHYPNSYPNRFAVFFLLLCLSLCTDLCSELEKQNYRSLSIRKILFSGCIGCAIVVLCFFMADEVKEGYTYYYTIALFFFYMLAMFLLPYWKKMKYVLSIAAALELCLNYGYMYLTKLIMFEDVLKYVQSEDSAFDELVEWKGFSRVSSGDIEPFSNQGMLYGFKDINGFSSSMILPDEFFLNIGLRKQTNSLRGISWNQAVYSLLNIQYMLVDQTEGRLGIEELLHDSSYSAYNGLRLAGHQGTLDIIENPTVLSLGYMVNSDIQELRYDYYKGIFNDFSLGDKVNEWVSAVSGCDPVMVHVDMQEEELQVQNGAAMIAGHSLIAAKDNSTLTRDLNEKNGILLSAVDEGGASNDDIIVTISCCAKEDGYYYVEIGGIISPVGYLEAGDTTQVYYTIEHEDMSKTDGVVTLMKEYYRFDLDEWNKVFEQLSKQQMEVIDYDSTHVNGRITVTEPGLLFTSIPYDDNWHAYVDGVEAELVPVLDNTFLSVKMPEGEHTISFVYRQKGLYLGMMLTSTMIIGFIGFTIFEGKRGSKGKK